MRFTTANKKNRRIELTPSSPPGNRVRGAAPLLVTSIRHGTRSGWRELCCKYGIFAHSHILFGNADLWASRIFGDSTRTLWKRTAHNIYIYAWFSIIFIYLWNLVRTQRVRGVRKYGRKEVECGVSGCLLSRSVGGECISHPVFVCVFDMQRLNIGWFGVYSSISKLIICIFKIRTSTCLLISP